MNVLKKFSGYALNQFAMKVNSIYNNINTLLEKTVDYKVETTNSDDKIITDITEWDKLIDKAIAPDKFIDFLTKHKTTYP